jgi:hypothetical protein
MTQLEREVLPLARCREVLPSCNEAQLSTIREAILLFAEFVITHAFTRPRIAARWVVHDVDDRAESSDDRDARLPRSQPIGARWVQPQWQRFEMQD